MKTEIGCGSTHGMTTPQIIGLILVFMLVGYACTFPLLKKHRQRSIHRDCMTNLQNLENTQVLWCNYHGGTNQPMSPQVQEEILASIDDRKCRAGGTYIIGETTDESPICTHPTHRSGSLETRRVLLERRVERHP